MFVFHNAVLIGANNSVGEKRPPWLRTLIKLLWCATQFGYNGTYLAGEGKVKAADGIRVG
jgi:hypothetical protein